MRLSSAQIAVVGGLILVIVGLALLVSRSGPSGPLVEAEFQSVQGLVKGNEVRIAGAPAGSVEAIRLSERNTALVTLRLHDGIDPPQADASAAVRPVDLLGDNYLSLSPGSAAEELDGPIVLARTSAAPRLDDVLRVFGEPVRSGMKAVLVELGTGLERRGVDLNRAAVELKPALDAADGLMGELGSQNASLRRLVTDAHRASTQLAVRSRELGGLVDSFAGTVKETSAHSAALDAGLETLPATLAQARSTADRLTRTARAAEPLVRDVSDAAPGLATASDRLGPFLRVAEDATTDLRPTVTKFTSLLGSADPTAKDLESGLRELRAVSPDLALFLERLAPAAPAISEGFFVNFADEAEEPGDQPFDPFADPARKYWRGAAVFSCEAFGVKVEPGCLANFLDNGPAPAGKDPVRPSMRLDGGKDGQAAREADRSDSADSSSDEQQAGQAGGDDLGSRLQKTTRDLGSRVHDGAGKLLDFLLGS